MQQPTYGGAGATAPLLGPAPTPGHLLRLLREGRAATRSELSRGTGLSRAAVTARLEALRRLGLVVEGGAGPSTGGRPPSRVEFNPAGGVVLAASLGAARTQLAVCDLAAQVLAQTEVELDLRVGPEAALAEVEAGLAELLAATDRAGAPVLGVGLGVPGPVEHAAGRTISPPSLPGWHGVALPPLLQRRWPVPVLVDNDVKVMALGEHRSAYAGRVDDLLLVKVSTGIGAAAVLGGRLHRGALGAAGDLGHVRVPGVSGVPCSCGNDGCLEAVAGGAALLRSLRARGRSLSRVPDLVALAAHDEQVRGMVRTAGRHLGEVLAAAVNLLNPAVLVLAGDLAAEEHLFTGVRDVVYSRSTVLATRSLELVPSVLGTSSGIVGCAVLVLDEALSPSAVDAALARREGGAARVS